MHNKFDFFAQRSLRAHHFAPPSADSWLVPEMLAKEAITMIYAESGVGKSWVSLALSSLVAPSLACIIYIDRENRLGDLESRGVKRLVDTHAHFFYLHRTTMGVDGKTTLAQMAQLAQGGYYKNTLIILDGAKHFVSDIEIDRQVRELMELVMALRDDGATVLIVHHTNKSGVNYQGSKELFDYSDYVFSASKVPSAVGKITVILEPQKIRGGIVNEVARQICTSSLQMECVDVDSARMSETESILVKAITTALATASDGMTQTQLLQAIGRDRTDKGARNILDRYEGTLWFVQKDAKNKLYTQSDTQRTLVHSPKENTLF